MTFIEIILIIVGMVFILASFWVTEKLSPDELEHISELSKEEMSVMLERELDKSRQRVVDIVEETIDASKEQTERSLEKQTNEKIMAINEYSDTVIEKMNKTHNEIMFLYSMLNDKHTELTDFTSELSQHLQQFKSQEEEMTNHFLNQLKMQSRQSRNRRLRLLFRLRRRKSRCSRPLLLRLPQTKSSRRRRQTAKRTRKHPVQKRKKK